MQQASALKTFLHFNGKLLVRKTEKKAVAGSEKHDLVLETLDLFELTYTHMYVAVVDDKTCHTYTQHDKHVYRQDDVARLFPYAQTVDYSLIMPIVHPLCRCMLVLLEAGP